MLTYILFRLLGVVFPLVPRRLGYAVMGIVAAVLYRLSGRNRQMIQANVRHVVGGEADIWEVDRIARRIFHNLLKNYFDLFWLPAQPTEKVARLITVVGYENAEEAIRLGKGVIAVAIHLGNQEIMTQVRAITDQKLTIVAEHVKPERVFRYLVALRQTTGLRLIPHDGPLLEIFRTLKRGEVVGLVFDYDVRGDGRVIPLFGAPARLPDGYAILALKLGAPVVPCCVVRQPDETYRAIIEKPMLFKGDARSDEDVRRVMMAVASVFERYLRQYVDQWVYFHYVWEEDKERARVEV